MRRALPFVILVVGLFALAIDFWPGLRLPFGGQDGGSRVVETKLGLDLEGGLRVEYQALPVGDDTVSGQDLAVIRDIIERRVNASGVAEPVVVTQGVDRVVVELPGIDNPDAIRRLVGQTGKLEFVPIPPGQQVSDGQKLDLEQFPPLFGGEELSSATLGQDRLGALAVNFTLRGEGSEKFARYTTDHRGEQFAIALDGTIISAPVINDPITNGQGQITQQGGFPATEAKELVTVLQYGSLPHPVQEVSTQTIAPTLGQTFQEQGLMAAVVGIGLVAAMMIVYYRLPGIVAVLALIFYTIVVLAIFRFIPVTLTLAGIAGFVLSIGMAVDANILIFERMKEEVRAGKSLPAAIEAGFNRAWNSILDSNVSSLITAGILFWFGSSVIRGFALVLMIGVLCSMFTAIVVSRTILRFIVQRQSLRRAWLYGVEESEFLARPTGRPGAREARGRA
jgi:preprotein translocase subunit SecD